MKSHKPGQDALAPGKPVLRMDGYVLVRFKRRESEGIPGTDLWLAPADGVGEFQFIFMPDHMDEWRSSDFDERVEQLGTQRKGL